MRVKVATGSGPEQNCPHQSKIKDLINYGTYYQLSRRILEFTDE